MIHARRAGRALLLAALTLSLSGCITRTVRESVFEKDQTQVLLRSEKRGGEPVDRGFEHPVTIAPVRMAHILSRIDLRVDKKDKRERRHAIPTETLYLIAAGVSDALAKADSTQEVVVLSVRRTKRLGIFDRNYLTSLLCYVKDDLLFIQISRSDWEIPPRRRERLPETHVGEHPRPFRLLADRAMSLADAQTVAVAWKDPVFRKPTRTRITPSGKVVRRTVLMESLEEDPTEFEAQPQLGDLSPQTLRDLADLEEARSRGEIGETEYTIRRNEILAADPASR